jgi:thymidylate synthase
LKIDESILDIDAFKFEHFTVDGYEPHAAIKMEMAV